MKMAVLLPEKVYPCTFNINKYSTSQVQGQSPRCARNLRYIFPVWYVEYYSIYSTVRQGFLSLQKYSRYVNQSGGFGL